MFEHRVASRQQIQCRFFSTTCRITAQKRLSKLVEAKILLVSGEKYKSKWVAVYGLSDHGIELASNSYKYQVANPICKSDSVIHDLSLVDLREKLEKAKILTGFFSESVLQSCEKIPGLSELRDYRQLNSDAAVIIKTPAGSFSVALENEITVKNLSRYVRKIRDYYLASNIEAVLYVCGNAKIEKAVRQADTEVETDEDPKIFTCQSDLIQNGTLPIPFLNQKNKTLFLQ